MSFNIKQIPKKDREKFKQLIEALKCPMDCEKCDLKVRECLINIRICLNILFRNNLKRIRKHKQKHSNSNGMIS